MEEGFLTTSDSLTPDGLSTSANAVDNFFLRNIAKTKGSEQANPLKPANRAPFNADHFSLKSVASVTSKTVLARPLSSERRATSFARCVVTPTTSATSSECYMNSRTPPSSNGQGQRISIGSDVSVRTARSMRCLFRSVRLMQLRIVTILKVVLCIVLITPVSFVTFITWTNTSVKDGEGLKPNDLIIDSFIELIYPYKISREELEFPLAFSVLIYKDIERAIRLLLAVYRSHNFYCIHVDLHSSENYFKVIKEFAKWLGPNVFVVPTAQRVYVKWGQMSTVHADLICSKLLLNASSKWKYWINLTGHEFPLRTNWELVAALKAMNNTNLAFGNRTPKEPWRLPPPSLLPFKITWMKGSVHVAVRREFVDYMNNSPRAIALLQALTDWEQISRRKVFADEQFFATLNHNPTVFPIPGAYLGSNSSELLNPLITRWKVWEFEHLPCGSGHWQRNICMLGMADLPRLKKSGHLFANKFIPEVDPVAYDELERTIRDRVIREAETGHLNVNFHPEFYSALEISKNHI
ncbi:unnamed protein product [Calicophoron daubneyi]|uniref:Uncharacterized protein n=1 Tax=Calicophoron daubneyi TaxID=300641 RepID=A0AAV2TVF0_CALDB